MVKRRGPPSQGWRTFLRNHALDIAAMDLFVVPTIGFDLLYAFVIVRLDRRDIIWINVTRCPTAEWVARQITEAFPWDEAPKYLIRDRDRIYGSVVTRRLRAMGIRDKPTAAASPWQNGFVERLIGSIRRECVDHIIVLGEAQLRRILRTYARYYNDIRNASVIGQRCASLSQSSVGRKHQIASHHRRTSPPLRPGLGFQYTQDQSSGREHTSSVPCVYAESNFRYTRVWDPTTLTKKMPSESLQSSVEPQRPADQRLSRSTVAAGDATICTSTSDSVTGNEQLCPRQTNAAPSVVA
jgi:hypothetical protein